MENEKYIIEICNGKTVISQEKTIYKPQKSYYDYQKGIWIRMAMDAVPLKFEIDRDALKKILEDIDD